MSNHINEGSKLSVDALTLLDLILILELVLLLVSDALNLPCDSNGIMAEPDTLHPLHVCRMDMDSVSFISNAGH